MIIPMQINNYSSIQSFMLTLEKLNVVKFYVEPIHIHISYMNSNRTYMNLPINLDIVGPNCWKVDVLNGLN
jgi:hypothetical protein